ncbi:coiled-coil domain-containing protein 201 [Dipodomys merriami]|uniref:coiled-coil domain-containing protein 201 n=1 Tax=Dipodomys merriami TaxID=94247 RepID=UPI003855D8AF
MTQVPGLSSSEDDSPTLQSRPARRKAKVAKHSTPKPPGRASRRRGSAVGPAAAPGAPDGSTGGSGPGGGRPAAGQPPGSTPASPARNPGLPGVRDTGGKRKQGPKRRAVEMERVRQWEACLLQQIEEAVQHELTIEYEDC